MSGKCKNCYDCKNLCRYYTKGIKQFNKTKYGWCNIKNVIVSINDSCDKFILKRKIQLNKNSLVLYHLNETLTDLAAMRMIIADEKIGDADGEK